MHQTRQEVITKIPIKRKGSKYVARAASDNSESVPVVIAIRDLLKLARTSREVKGMIHSKSLKLNGKTVKDLNESVKLFSILEADKKYLLTLLPTGRFSFVETKESSRLCKVISRSLFSGNKIQLNLHDGSNVLGSKDIKVGDSIYLDFSSKVKSHVKLEKGKDCFITLGKYIGHQGKILDLKEKNAKIKFEDKGEAELPLNSITVQ